MKIFDYFMIAWKCKKKYFVNKFTETCGNPAKTWKVIKSVMQKGAVHFF